MATPNLTVRSSRGLRYATLAAVAGFALGVSNLEAQTGQTGQPAQGGTGQGGGTTIGVGTGGQGVGGQGVGGQGVGGQGIGGQGAQSPTFMTFGTEVDVTGGTGFVGRGDAAQNFVGGTIQPGQGAAQNFGPANSQFAAINRQGQVARGTQQAGPSRSERIRPRHRIAFSYTPRQTESIAATLQSRLTNLSSPIAGVQVTLDNEGTAILSGTTDSTYDARLAAALARLEPGVRTVRNELTVAEGND